MAVDKKANTTTKAAALVIVMVGLIMMAHGPKAQAQAPGGQNCTVQLTDLTTCAPFVVPGASTPSPNSQCCTALKGVDTGCLCNTLHMVAQLPASCSLPAVSCDL